MPTEQMHGVTATASFVVVEMSLFSAEPVDPEDYAKPSLKKCRPIAARNEDKKVFSGRL